MEITESAVNYVRQTINSRMYGKYDAWQKEVQNLREITDSPKLTAILDFIQSGADGLHFSSSNFKIQHDYNEDLRESSSKIMNIVSERSLFFLGGSADVVSSTKTYLKGKNDFSAENYLGSEVSANE